MPPPRKIDLMPAEFRDWLKEELEKRGFAGYEQLSEDLNFRLEEAGLEMSVGKSAIHSFGQEHAEFVKLQEQSSAWAAEWLNDNGLEEEARRHNVLFQMITSLAFKVMQSQMVKDGTEIDPRELSFLGKMLKDVMTSSGMREKLMADERERVAKEAREAEREQLTEQFDKVTSEAGLSEDRVAQMRRDFLGVRTA